jgi:predicted tellurium resistance membrane protein TerC
MLLDIVFSLDSVITAVGMADHIEIMVAAVIVAVGVMLFAADAVSNFVNRHPTVKMLALSFLLLVGITLVADGLGFHIPKGYLYFAIAFSVLVEMLNLAASKRRNQGKAPAHGHSPQGTIVRPGAAQARIYGKDAPLGGE